MIAVPTSDDCGSLQLEAERERERQGRAEAEAALNAMRVEAATLTERAAHIEELRVLVRSLQGRKRGQSEG